MAKQKNATRPEPMTRWKFIIYDDLSSDMEVPRRHAGSVLAVCVHNHAGELPQVILHEARHEAQTFCPRARLLVASNPSDPIIASPMTFGSGTAGDVINRVTNAMESA